MERKKHGGQLGSHMSAMMCGPHNSQGAGPPPQKLTCDVSGGSSKKVFPREEFGPTENLSQPRKESKASVSQVRLQETFISVGSLENDEEGTQQSEAWKRKRRRSLQTPNTTDYMRSSSVKRETHPLEENMVLSMFGSAFNVFLILFVSIPITLLVGVILPFALLAKVLAIVCSGHLHYACASCRANRLSAHDAQFFLHGTQPAMHSILIIDGSIDLKRVRHTLASRVIQAKTGSGGYMYPRLTQIVVHLPSGPSWYIDNKFNLHNHIFSGPEITSEEGLQKYIAKLLFQPLRTSRPLWEVIVLNSFGRNRDTVLICRLHHCIADGMSLLRVLCQSLSDNQIMHIPQKPHFGGTTYGMNLFRSFLIGPLTALTWMYWWKPDKNLLVYRKPTTSVRHSSSLTSSTANGTKQCCGCGGRVETNGPNSVTSDSNDRVRTGGSVNSEVGAYTVLGVGENTGFFVLWSSAIPMSKVIRIKQVTRTCLNDVLLASVAGAIRNSLQKLGVVNPPNVRVNLAVDLRSSSLPFTVPELGTKASVVALSLPVEIESAIPRIWRVREALEEMKASADAVVSYCFVWWAYKCLPRPWCTTLLHRLHSKGSLQYSSLPGPSSALLLGGYTVKRIYNISPPRDPLNLSVTILTYLDKVHMTVCVRRTMPHARWIARNILRDMERQCEQMNETLSHRRLPGEQKKPFFLSSTSEMHASRPLSELQSTLARVQTELQKVTEQYELEFRRGLYSKSKSSDFAKYQPAPSVDYEDEMRSEVSSPPLTSLIDKPRRVGGGPGGTPYRRGSASASPVAPSRQELACKVQTLKQEFTDLLTEIRRRKSLTEGSLPSSTGLQVEEEDGEMRRARKRALSVVSVRSMASVTSLSSVSSRDFSPKESSAAQPSTSSVRPLIAPSVVSHSDFSTPPSTSVPVDEMSSLTSTITEIT